jgi:GTP cyclohydrolase I
MVTFLKDYMSKQDEVQEKMMKHEAAQLQAQLEAEGKLREQEQRHNMEMMRMMTFANSSGGTQTSRSIFCIKLPCAVVTLAS